MFTSMTMFCLITYDSFASFSFRVPPVYAIETQLHVYSSQHVKIIHANIKIKTSYTVVSHIIPPHTCERLQKYNTETNLINI